MAIVNTAWYVMTSAIDDARVGEARSLSESAICLTFYTDVETTHDILNQTSDRHHFTRLDTFRITIRSTVIPEARGYLLR